MTSDIQRVYSIKSHPLQQCQQLLNWFAHIDVKTFDVQVRRYPNRTRSQESWVTCHQKITAVKVLDLWEWMRYENSHEADIYFRPHGQEDHSVIFLDDLNLTKAYQVAKAYCAAVVQTSNNNTQVWVRTSERLSAKLRKQVQSNICQKGYSDPGSVSGDHLGRMPGMFSQKRRVWVNAIFFSTPNAYQASISTNTTPIRGRGACALSSKYGKSASEVDFGQAIGMYRSGANYNNVYLTILGNARSRGKRNAENYARLTAQKSGITSESLQEFDRR